MSALTYPTRLIDLPAVRTELAAYGLMGTGGSVVFLDLDRARTAYLRRQRAAVAAVAYALAEPMFANGRFPKLSLLDAVAFRPGMDATQLHTLAAVCGVDSLPPGFRFQAPFGEHAWDIVDRYELEALFLEAPSYSPRPSHRALRPRGFDWGAPGQAEIPGALTQWRRHYRALPLVRQIMASTLMTLYRGEVDRTWLKHVEKSWLVGDAIDTLRHADALQDWGRLVVLYPGW
jgi:hypothetical protein